MINEAQVFLAGYVAREPRFRITTRGIPERLAAGGLHPAVGGPRDG